MEMVVINICLPVYYLYFYLLNTFPNTNAKPQKIPVDVTQPGFLWFKRSSL